jgi:hypothetical protein
MYKLVIRQRAVKMAIEAFEWYEERQNGLGEDFLIALTNCYERIKVWPTSGTNIKDGFRQINLKKFPYGGCKINCVKV